MSNMKTKRMIISALFLALGIVLPLFTAQIKEIGDSLLPMHIPVMLTGLICGPFSGFLVGFLMPFLRSVLFSMPPIYPNAVWMALELMTYGFVIGFLYQKAKKKTVGYLYFSLVLSMISGRIVWGISKAILLGLGGKSFTFGAFITGGLIDAALGIILQFILIPAVMEIIIKRK